MYAYKDQKKISSNVSSEITNDYNFLNLLSVVSK